MTSTFQLPEALERRRELGPTWGAWLDVLPGRVHELADEWELTFDGDAMHGFGSVVVPVREASGRASVLKVSFDGDQEGLHEALGLQHWDGNGTVRMYRADPRRRALVLERLDSGRDLDALPVLEACEVVAAMYERLHVPALPRLQRLSTYIDRWTERLALLPADSAVPHRLVEQAVSLGRAFVADPDTDAVMIHGDLHFQNVLAADREPWLVIDPKPMAGDAHYEIAPMLWNRWEEAVATGDVRFALRRRFHTIVDAAGLDEDRARHWVVVRELHNVLWVIEDAATMSRPLSAEDRDDITVAVTIAKAVQD
ncbi:MAG: aminoglycoside resistance protein [Nocardioidaceae bacterium]|nr:aminoglycoside resistance protein [Nocardioidaceae bacterium]NUS52723.1 aminoglycoside resistance protein [Nocardioidaceae bacterium]